MIKFNLISAMLIAIIPSMSHAQCRNRFIDGGRCSQVIQSPITSTSTIIAPSNTLIVNHDQTVATAALIVPTYSFVSSPGYVPSFQTQQQPSAEAIADLVIQKLRLQSAPQPQYQPSQLQYQPQANQQFVQPRSDGGPPAIKQSTKKPTFSQEDKVRVEQLLTAKCASCHSGQATAGGGFSYFDDQRKLRNLSPKEKLDISDAVHDQSMPKGGEPVSDADNELIRIWRRQ